MVTRQIGQENRNGSESDPALHQIACPHQRRSGAKEKMLGKELLALPMRISNAG
jgi:hypothetical protein